MTPKPKSPSQGGRRRYGVIAVVALIFITASYGIYSVVNDDTAPRKRVLEQIAVKLVPPPPPPPPPKVEPPPEPPKMVEEQKIEPPVDQPDNKPQTEAPPPGPLALDAQGGAGGDAFGLAARPGGRDLLLGSGTGGNGFGNRFGRYAALMQDQIGRRLHDDEKLDVSRFRATVRIWLTETGQVEKVELARTTGDEMIDGLIAQALSSMPKMPEPPPREMPQPVIVRIGATPGFG
jgi:periplasmic protein TonB